jgi:hypothetical protein
MLDRLDTFVQSILKERRKKKYSYTVRFKKTSKGLALRYFDKYGEPAQGVTEMPAYYLIYDGLEQTPVYVGFGSFAPQRIYRFFKELYGLSRKDEKHYGAKKYKDDHPEKKSINKGQWRVEFIYLSDLPEASKGIVRYADEYLAEKLHSRYNEFTIEA